MRKTLVFLTLFLLQGCFVDEKITASSHSADSGQSLVTEVKEGALYIIEENSSYKLADDALDYRVIPSPKGSWLAVETLKLSNLIVVRFYKKDPEGRYRRKDVTASTHLWSDLSAKMGFDIDDIRFPRTKFIRWEDERHAHLNLSGVANRKKIDRNVTVTLP